ncbi:MAG: response regulator [Planctomycetaceae bacterium]|nr:response regulator [Planctomycetaceae bacterium]
MKKALSTLKIAGMLGVAVASVSNWIDQGLLKAGRTPGGHRRVLPEDLITFLRRQNLPIPPQIMPAHPKVLVVDDEEPLAQWIGEMILSQYPSCLVSLAHDGYAAGDMVASLKPDVVILDLRMPGMDGFEVCKRIKSKPHATHTCVIAVTAMHSPDVEKRILQCGAGACLPKPIDPDALLTHVEAALAHFPC